MTTLKPNVYRLKPVRSRRPTPAAFLLTLLLAVPCAAQGVVAAPEALPATAPETLGFSADRLKRIDEVMQQYVDEGRVAGVVTLVARDGRIAHLGAFGDADRERTRRMAPDTIFRIASMTKAITSVAAMMLVEEGRLALSDPVGKYIPAYKQTYVRVPPPEGAAAAGRIGSVPARRAITIRDLLTHTAGISYGAGPMEAEYRAAGAFMWYFADRTEPVDAVVERLAELPFDAHPGERYVYGFATDILGVVVERVSGLNLDEFFRRRILEPLKMVDTEFYLSPDRTQRLAAVYSATPEGRINRAPEGGMGQGDYVTGPRLAFSGGAGLLSTAGDYARFLQMLLNGGELDGVRLLAPKTVELMTSNVVGTLYAEGRLGFGLGFSIVEHVGRAGRLGSVGEFGWGGAYHTQYWVDPAEGLVVVFMSQLLPSGGLDLQEKFRNLVYQALIETRAD